MSGSAMLAPREDSDSAVGQEAAGDAAGEKAVDRYRTWVRDHRVSAALLAGLVATHLATVVGYFMPGIGLPQLDWNRINGAIYTPKASPDVQFLSGGVFHYVDGIVFTVVFAVAVYPLLRWRSATFGNALKGLFFFGTILATLSCAFMIPPGVLPRRPRRLLQPPPRLEAGAGRVRVALGVRTEPRHDLQPVPQRRPRNARDR